MGVYLLKKVSSKLGTSINFEEKRKQRGFQFLTGRGINDTNVREF